MFLPLWSWALIKLYLIPDVYLSQENLKNVLLHKKTWHIKNHDVFTKQIINILLVIMYWWFIPVYGLRDTG